MSEARERKIDAVDVLLMCCGRSRGALLGEAAVFNASTVPIWLDFANFPPTLCGTRSLGIQRNGASHGSQECKW